MTKLHSYKKDGKRYAEVEHANSDMVFSYSVNTLDVQNQNFSVMIDGADRVFVLKLTKEEVEKLHDSILNALVTWKRLNSQQVDPNDHPQNHIFNPNSPFPNSPFFGPKQQ